MTEKKLLSIVGGLLIAVLSAISGWVCKSVIDQGQRIAKLEANQRYFHGDAHAPGAE